MCASVERHRVDGDDTGSESVHEDGAGSPSDRWRVVRVSVASYYMKKEPYISSPCPTYLCICLFKKVKLRSCLCLCKLPKSMFSLICFSLTFWASNLL